MKYHYDKAIHPAKQSRESIFFLMGCGFLFLCAGIVGIYFSAEDSSNYQKGGFILLSCLGLLLMFMPKKFLGPGIAEGKKYINIYYDSIEWKLGKDRGFIKVEDIESYSMNVGEVIFKKKDQNSSTLPMYEIENQEKFEEIKSVLDEMFN